MNLFQPTRDPYGSHLEALGEHVPHGGKMVEFGCGLYSTPALLSRCDFLLSIEMQSEAWLGKVGAHVGRMGWAARWRGELALGPWGHLGVGVPGDVVFALVDGHGATRPECVNRMMAARCPVIAAHDTEAKMYGWGRVNPAGYTARVYTARVPWTTVWTLD